jgi:hypothetical protein
VAVRSSLRGGREFLPTEFYTWLRAVVRTIACCVLSLSCCSDAWADMGPLAIVPVVGALLLQIVLAVILIAPSRTRGVRRRRVVVFCLMLGIPWLGTLMTPADSFYHFVPLLIAMLVIFGLMFYRDARQ